MTASKIRIDLYSDTITRPTPAMRQFISRADVGDEQKREDPTVNRLVEKVCELLGKEDYALEHHVERLADDHANAQILARGLVEIDGLTVEPVETNLVFFDVAGLGLSGREFEQKLLEQGVRVSVMGPTRIRAVTHLDVSRDQVLEAVEIIRGLVNKLA